VHNLPAPDAVLARHPRPTPPGRRQALLLALGCAAPGIASDYRHHGARPAPRPSCGELIEPPPPHPPAPAPDRRGRPAARAPLEGPQLLLSVAGGACDAACENNLYLQRQLREGLGKDKDRLDWVWLVSDDARLPEALLPALGQATVLRVPPAVLADWLAPAAGQALTEHLYVVDPMGHWMMRFPAGLDKAGAGRAKRDLERLKRASASWDQAGR